MNTVVACLIVTACACGRFGFSGRELAELDAMAAVDGAIAMHDVAADAVITPNYVFVTSTSQMVCPMGLAAADAICASLATAAHLPGTYVAWMSTPTVNAKDRLGTARGWIRTDGKPFADTIADVASGHVFYPPRFDETGADVGYAFTTSATDVGGIYSTADGCSLGGLPSDGGEAWFSGILETTGRIHCFGIDSSFVETPTPATGRHTFVSTAAFTPSTGIAMADAICASEATSAGLTGTYNAFLPTTTTSASSRFNLNGAIWIRPDGTPLVAQASDIATWSLIAPIAQHVDGTLIDTSVWSGSAVTNPSSASTCTNWSSAAPSNGATTHSTETAQFGEWLQSTCSTAWPVFCFEQ